MTILPPTQVLLVRAFVGYVVCCCESREWLILQERRRMRRGEEEKNRRVLFKGFIKGWPTEADFIHEESTCKMEVGAGSKDVLIKTLYLSVDPYMRGRMKGNKDSYIPPFTPGDVITGFSVGKVVMSDHPGFEEGDIVSGFTGWEEYYTAKGGHGIELVPDNDLPPSYYAGVLGIPGFTAWAGFYQICKPKAGEHVFISAASGAVGQLVGQFAKMTGCHVVGSAGSNDKVKLLKEKLGFDDAFNYKYADDLEAALRKHFRDGIDIYFDNVGGKMLDAVLNVMNLNGRISACGMISQYNRDEDGEPIYNIRQVVPKRIKISGFIIADFAHLRPKFMQYVISALKKEELVYVEDVEEGIHKAPSAFIGLLSGQNVGKKLVRVATH